ncbi:hypothetical protein [Ruminococcus sp.]|uniref:hypothetical protein n=1 Tax=Ruminococcus sp. TaxID=41978 RepID=UPI003F0BC995
MKKYFLQPKVWTTLYIVTLILNYSLILFSVLFYRGGSSLIEPVLLLSQGILTIINCIVSRNLIQFAILSANLLVSTIVANIVATQLYFQNISADDETLIFGWWALIIGCIYVVIISVLAIFLKKIISKYMN